MNFCSRGTLQPISPKPTPFEKIGIDKLGPFPTSVENNKYIIVCTDYCTKTVIASPTPNGTAIESAKFLLEKVILQYGAPKEIITDQGKEFLNKLVSEVTKMF